MNTLREVVAPGSKAHQDITEALEHGRPWFKNGLRYTPTHARMEGRHIVIDMRLQDEQPPAA